MRSLVRILALAGLLCFGTAITLQAQSVTATLVGTVTDQSGAAVPTATHAAPLSIGVSYTRATTAPPMSLSAPTAPYTVAPTPESLPSAVTNETGAANPFISVSP